MAEETKTTSTRGRKPKAQVEEVKKDVVDLELESSDDKDMIKKLMQQMAELQKQVEDSKKEKDNMSQLIDVLKNSKTTEEDSDELTSDTDITVISQTVGKLSLFTEGFGLGTEYVFNNFGDVLDISFGDLKEIVKNNRSFAQKGYFYIANNEAVNKLRLKANYQRLLSNDDMMTILEKDADKIMELYDLAPEGQKQIIIDLIVDKKLNKEKISADILLALGEKCGRDLINID